MILRRLTTAAVLLGLVCLCSSPVFSATALNYVKAEVSLAWLFRNTVETNIVADFEYDFAVDDKMTDGDGVDMADMVFYDERTITNGGGPDTIDLDGTGFQDAFGADLACDKLKGLMVYNTTTTAGASLNLGGNAAEVPYFGAVADYIVIDPGGLFVWWAPSAAAIEVTATTGDIIQLDENGSVDVTYRIAIVCAL